MRAHNLQHAKRTLQPCEGGAQPGEVEGGHCHIGRRERGALSVVQAAPQAHHALHALVVDQHSEGALADPCVQVWALADQEGGHLT